MLLKFVANFIWQERCDVEGDVKDGSFDAAGRDGVGKSAAGRFGITDLRRMRRLSFEEPIRGRICSRNNAMTPSCTRRQSPTPSHANIVFAVTCNIAPCKRRNSFHTLQLESKLASMWSALVCISPSQPSQLCFEWQVLQPAFRPSSARMTLSHSDPSLDEL
jgi:hypothetical protein